MYYEVLPGPRTGCIEAPSSKSEAHRLLLAAALSGGRTEVRFTGLSRDLQATLDCVRALGAGTEPLPGGRGAAVRGIFSEDAADASGGRSVLNCGESGSTLRFLIPLCGVLGRSAAFQRFGRLAERPLGPLLSALSEGGMAFSEDADGTLLSDGRLRSGKYRLPGNVSSQFFTGLLMSLPLLEGDSSLTAEGEPESADYIRMTESVLGACGISLCREGNTWFIPGGQRYCCPEVLEAGGDWSGAAAFLCMGAFSERGITVRGLSEKSDQGDRRVLSVLEEAGAGVERLADGIRVYRKELRGFRLDASGVPDLVPVLCAAACAAEGTTEIFHAERLRLKESDRLRTTAAMLEGLGADIRETKDGLFVRGRKELRGGDAESFRDHRIAMAAAAAASACRSSVRIEGAECAEKSYPSFYTDLKRLVPEDGTGGRKEGS